MEVVCLILGPTLTSKPCSHAFWVLTSLHLPLFLLKMFLLFLLLLDCQCLYFGVYYNINKFIEEALKQTHYTLDFFPEHFLIGGECVCQSLVPLFVDVLCIQFGILKKYLNDFLTPSYMNLSDISKKVSTCLSITSEFCKFLH